MTAFNGKIAPIRDQTCNLQTLCLIRQFQFCDSAARGKKVFSQAGWREEKLWNADDVPQEVVFLRN